MTSFAYKLYKTVDDWFSRNLATFDAILWANTMMWQILLTIVSIIEKAPELLILVAITLLALMFLDKYKKKRKSPQLQKIYGAIYALVHGIWMGMTYMFIISLIS